MTTIAILGFFVLILVFFYLGRDDFGLKPSSIQTEVKGVDDKSKTNELEELKS